MSGQPASSGRAASQSQPARQTASCSRRPSSHAATRGDVHVCSLLQVPMRASSTGARYSLDLSEQAQPVSAAAAVGVQLQTASLQTPLSHWQTAAPQQQTQLAQPQQLQTQAQPRSTFPASPARPGSSVGVAGGGPFAVRPPPPSAGRAASGGFGAPAARAYPRLNMQQQQQQQQQQQPLATTSSYTGSFSSQQQQQVHQLQQAQQQRTQVRSAAAGAAAEGIPARMHAQLPQYPMQSQPARFLVKAHATQSQPPGASLPFPRQQLPLSGPRPLSAAIAAGRHVGSRAAANAISNSSQFGSDEAAFPFSQPSIFAQTRHAQHERTYSHAPPPLSQSAQRSGGLGKRVAQDDFAASVTATKTARTSVGTRVSAQEPFLRNNQEPEPQLSQPKSRAAASSIVPCAVAMSAQQEDIDAIDATIMVDNEAVAAEERQMEAERADDQAAAAQPHTIQLAAASLHMSEFSAALVASEGSPTQLLQAASQEDDEGAHDERVLVAVEMEPTDDAEGLSDQWVRISIGPPKPILPSNAAAVASEESRSGQSVDESEMDSNLSLAAASQAAEPAESPSQAEPVAEVAVAAAQDEIVDTLPFSNIGEERVCDAQASEPGSETVNQRIEPPPIIPSEVAVAAPAPSIAFPIDSSDTEMKDAVVEATSPPKAQQMHPESNDGSAPAGEAAASASQPSTAAPHSSALPLVVDEVDQDQQEEEMDGGMGSETNTVSNRSISSQSSSLCFPALTSCLCLR